MKIIPIVLLNGIQGQENFEAISAQEPEIPYDNPYKAENVFPQNALRIESINKSRVIPGDFIQIIVSTSLYR